MTRTAGSSLYDPSIPIVSAARIGPGDHAGCCLHTRYRSLVLVNLDGSDPPAWVLESYQHFDRTQYPTEQLAGVVKARAQELGADLRAPSLADRAEAIERQRAIDAETVQLLGNSPKEWDAACNVLMGAIREEAAAISGRTGWPIECGPGALIGGFVVISRGAHLDAEMGASFSAEAAANLHGSVRARPSRCG